MACAPSKLDGSNPAAAAGETGLTPGGSVLVTGGAGFIGSHLCEALLERGYAVTALDDLSTGRLENLERVSSHPRFRIRVGTVTDENVVAALLRECEVVFHLAAAVGVRWILQDPVRALEGNAIGAQTILRVAHRERCKVLLASTSELYGKSDRVPFREDHDRLLGPTQRARWGYSSSKAFGEHLALAYHRQYGLPVVILRLFNTVGPRQQGRYGMVIPRFIEQALSGQALTVFGDGRQSRCFLHVADAVDGMIGLAACPRAAGEVVNIGSVEEVAILELARRILALADGDAAPRARLAGAERIVLVPYEQAYQPGLEDIRRRVPDLTKIEQLIGWRPRISLDQILRELLAAARAAAPHSPEPARPAAPPAPLID
jgi:UDP-glucose 4-epimerase